MSAPALPDRDALHRSIDSVWRIEAARIIASVARMTRDVGRAEELAQDALVAALEHWPQDGLPANPAGWLMTTAKRRAIDHLRQQALHQREHEALGHDLEALEAQYAPDVVDTLMHAEQDDIGDDLLRLIFTACHPVLPTEARVALTLRLLGGSPRPRLHAPFWCPSPPWPSASCAPSAASRPRRCRLRCPARPSVRRAWPRCWR